MSQHSRSKRDEPQTPYEVRMMTWQWIRARCQAPTLPGPHYSKLIAHYWEDAAFADASREMERLDPGYPANEQRNHAALWPMIEASRGMCRRLLVRECSGIVNAGTYATSERVGGGA